MLGCELYLIDKDIEEIAIILKEICCVTPKEENYSKKYLNGREPNTNVDIVPPVQLNTEKWIKIEHTKFDLYKCLPLETNARIVKILLWKPRKHKKTVLFANSDILTIIYNINRIRKLAITGIMLDLDLPGEDHYLPCYYFEHWNKDNSFRLVRVMCDPRWVFYEEGERFPFEQVEKYNERIKKKRLTNDMIKDYVTAMGWNIRDEGFFDSDQDAVFITVKRW